MVLPVYTNADGGLEKKRSHTNMVHHEIRTGHNCIISGGSSDYIIFSINKDKFHWHTL